MKGPTIATFIIAVLNSGLTVLNIPIHVQTIIQGAVLVISLMSSIDLERTGKRKTKLSMCSKTTRLKMAKGYMFFRPNE